MTDGNSRASVLPGLRWATLSRGIMQLITWSATFLVVRLLSPSDYGLVAMATVIASYLTLLGELGFGTALIQKRTQDSETLRSVFGALITTGAVLFAVAAVAAPLVARYFKEPALVGLSTLAAAQFLLMPFTVIPMATLSIHLQFRAIGIAGMASALFGAACTLTMAYFKYGPYALIVGTLLGSVARVVALNVMAPFLSAPRFSLRAIREFVGFSGIVLTERSIWYWYAQADAVIVGTALGARSLGIFSVAKQLAAIPHERFAEIMNMVALPAFAAVKNDLQRVRDGYLKATRIGAAFSFPVFAGLAAVAGDLVHVIIGKKWDASIPVLQLICVSMPLRVIASVASPVVTAIGRPDVSLKCILWAATCVPVLMIIGVHWGLLGVAGAWALGYPIAFVGGSRLVAKTLGTTLWVILRPLVSPLLCSAIMVAAVLLADQTVLAGLPALVRLGLSVLSGVVAYGAAMWTLARAQFQDVKAFALAIFSGRTRAAG